ncbi:hypothetical protein [Heyndrickxia vini]|uniref:Transcription initiation factor TFIIIB n=1 Tax=Heyndrickxia vini TaxID=1476025 RepID=A0ABX7E6M2_9BACI|nr:hypothetical protein [Heyndrickxia vini]QQZ09982.1 hypothetical protein I5776_03145 [Heyndrickxia vini]
MENQQPCKTCGKTEFVQGKLGNGYSSLTEVDKILGKSSPLIFTFCKNCGEISSIKVKNPHNF